MAIFYYSMKIVVIFAFEVRQNHITQPISFYYTRYNQAKPDDPNGVELKNIWKTGPF